MSETTQLKTLDDLTPEIKERIPMWKDKCTVDLYSGKEYAEWKREYSVEYMNYVYKLCERPSPMVIIANNLEQYHKYFNLLFNEKINARFKERVEGFMSKKRTDSEVEAESVKLQEELYQLGFDTEKDNPVLQEKPKYHWISIVSEYSRVYLTWYKFIKDEFNLPCSKAEELDTLYSMVFKASIAKVFVCEDICLVLRMPSKICRNNLGLHNTSDNKGAIQYPGEALHFINGRKMESWIFDKYFSGTLTFDDFVNCVDEDLKGGIITLIKDNEGNKGLMKFLNAQLIDEKILTHENGHTETIRLYKSKDSYPFLSDHLGNTNVPYAWSNLICPSTGTEYLIDNSAAFTDAIEAVKFLRPDGVPNSLAYNWLAFTN